MKRLTIIALMIFCVSSLWSQEEGVFPTQNASGNLYLGTDSYLFFSLGGNQSQLGARLGLAGQYFVSEDLAVGFVAGVDGSRYNFEDRTFSNVSGSRNLVAGLNATYYFSSCRMPCYQPFIRTELSFRRGRSSYETDVREAVFTKAGGVSLGFAPGVTIALKNNALLNISASILAITSRRIGSGNTASRDLFVSGGINSGVGVELIKQF